MSESQAPATPEPVAVEKINPIDNLGAWLDNETRDTKGEASPAAQPAATPTPEPPKPEINWRDVKFGDDVENAFFKGKPVTEAVKSHYEMMRMHQTYKENAERELKELRDQVLESRAQRAAQQALQEMIAQQSGGQQAEAIDPRLAKAEELWHTDPAQAYRLISAVNQEEARRIAQAEAQSVRQQWTEEQQQQQVVQTGTQVYQQVVQKLAADYGIDAQTAQMRADYLIPIITAEHNPWGGSAAIFNAGNYLDAHEKIFGKPQTAPKSPIVVAAPPPIANPPGNSRPAPAVQPAQNVSPVDDEKMQIYRALVGDNEDVLKKFIAKQQRKA